MDNKLPHILIVDDDPNLLATMSDILKLKGYEPVAAQTGKIALAQLVEHRFALALVDLRLEDMSGLIVLRAIKTHSPETECILLTGHASQNSAIEAIEMGIYGYFQKPFDMGQILLSIQRALEKRATAQDLRESERFARATVDALSSHIAILDETGVILAVNRAWHEFAKANSGGSPDLKVYEGANYLSVCDTATGKYSEEAPIIAAGIRSVMSGKQNEFLLEYPCHSPEEKRWFIARVTRFPGEAPLRVVVAHENITERKQAEGKLAQTERRSRALIENAPDGIVLVGLDGKYKYGSPTALRIFGYTVEEIVDRNPADSTHPEDLTMVLQVLQDLIANPSKVPTIQYRFQHRDESWRWVESTFTNLLVEPSVEAIVINFHDITERKQAEDAQQQSELQFRTLFDLSPDAVMLIDPHDPNISWPIIDCNASACVMNGYGRDELVGYSIDIVNTTTGNRAERSAYLKKLRKAGNLKLETFHRHKNGAVFPIEVSTAIINIGERELIIGMDRDITERKLAEDAIRVSETKYRVLTENMKDVVWTMDAETMRFLYISPSVQKLRGYTAEEIIAEPITAALMPDAANAIQEIIRKRVTDLRSGLIPSDNYFTTCLEQPCKDGSTVWAEQISHYYLNEESGHVEARVVTRDITERIKAENELRQSEERFQQLANNIEETFWIMEAEKEIYISPAGEKLWGIPIEKLYQERAFLENVLPEDRQIILGNIEKQLRGEKTEMEYRVQYSDGTMRWVWDRAFPVLDKTGKVMRVTGIAADITERKQAEENIQQRVTELELLYESGLAFSQLLNQKEIAQKIIELLGEKLDWHHTTIRLIRGQEELELVGFDQPGLEDKAGVEAHFNKLITRIGEGLSGWTLQQARIIRLGDVASDPHYVASYPGIHSGLYVPLKSGNQMLGVISIESEQPNAFSEADEHLLTTLANQAANAFENARLYKETINHAQELDQRVQERTADLNRVNTDLAQAVRVKDEFLASMSHELRTPLTGILGLSEVLQLKVYGELNDKQNKTVKTIEESGRHLLDLINDILDLSKIEAGKFEMQFGLYPLVDICQASLQLIKGMAQFKRQHVQFSPPTESIIVRVDARRLKQLLVNLLGNAIKFTPENGELGLEVEANKSERKIKLTVWDKGIGIKPEDAPKLFRPFVQVDSSLAREYSGTGLGLSLVQHLTDLHNGSIEVESKFGKGSRFTIILPWSPQNTIPISYPPHRGTGPLFNSAILSEPSKASLVMFADDNEMVLQMITDFLEIERYRVIAVRSGFELLEQAAEFHPDIMLVDIQMPVMGGLETIQRIRSHADPRVAATPVIAVTALAMPADREKCLRAGANDYLSKPLKLKELASSIRKLLERKQ